MKLRIQPIFVTIYILYICTDDPWIYVSTKIQFFTNHENWYPRI